MAVCSQVGSTCNFKYFGVVLDHCGEESAELEGKALDLPVDLHDLSLTSGHERWVVTENSSQNWFW